MKSAKVIPFRKPKLATDPTTDSMLKLAWAPWIIGAVVVSMMFNFWRHK